MALCPDTLLKRKVVFSCWRNKKLRGQAAHPDKIESVAAPVSLAGEMSGIAAERLMRIFPGAKGTTGILIFSRGTLERLLATQVVFSCDPGSAI